MAIVRQIDKLSHRELKLDEAKGDFAENFSEGGKLVILLHNST